MTDYVTFTSSGIHVDVVRFLKTDKGKKLLADVEKASKRFEKPVSNPSTNVEMASKLYDAVLARPESDSAEGYAEEWIDSTNELMRDVASFLLQAHLDEK